MPAGAPVNPEPVPHIAISETELDADQALFNFNANETNSQSAKNKASNCKGQSAQVIERSVEKRRIKNPHSMLTDFPSPRYRLVSYRPLVLSSPGYLPAIPRCRFFDRCRRWIRNRTSRQRSRPSISCPGEEPRRRDRSPANHSARYKTAMQKIRS